MANVNFFSPDGGTTRYPIEDTEARNRITGQQSLLKDTVGWIGKNRLNIPDQTLTSDGVTIRINNGVASFSGTNALSGALWITGTGINIPKGTYIFNGLDTTQNIVSNLQLLQSDNTEIVTTSGKDSSKTVTIPNDLSNCKVHFRIVANGNTDGIKAYPMLRDASITDDTYEPHHESVEDVVEQIYADNGVLGAKNLFKVTATSQTRDGVTFTVNKDSDGNVLNVTANGTSADGRILLGRVELDVGTYKLNGSPKSPNLYDWRFRLFDPNTDFVIAWDDGEGVTFTVSTKTTYELQIRYAGNVTFNNVVFMPMIRLASDPDDTYQPYVMTNRELTEDVLSLNTGLLPQLTLSDRYGGTADKAINIDTINKPYGYMININAGSYFSGTAPTDVGNSFMLIGFSSIVAGGVEYGAQLAFGWSANKIGIRKAGYSAQGTTWGAWQYFSIS